MERGGSSEQLMAEMAWVRRLARALVRDPSAADDVAQEALIVAAEHAPPGDRPLRPWLARVVQNVARMRWRSEHRREAREAGAELPDAVPSPSELVERVELQRIVAGEVLALAEPYRSTILLHFVEGYSSAEIARRLGIPDGTVRRRLKVALDQLRAALGARRDGRPGGVLAALAPLAAHSPTLGVIAMKKLAAVIVLVVLAALLVFVATRGRHRAATRIADPAGPAAPVRPERPAAALVPTWLAQTGAPDRRVAGHVTAAGAPVAHATVRLSLAVDGAGPQILVEVASAADGSFDFGMQPAATFVVSASAPAHAPAAVVVHAGDPAARPDRVRLELGDCSSHMFGAVRDASGGPIEHARLIAAGASGTESDAAGHYSLCLPAGAPVVRVDADGYGSLEQRFGTANGLNTLSGDLRRDFVLVPEAVLAGTVVDASSHPVAGARIVARPMTDEQRRHVAAGWAISGADGRFRVMGLAPAQFALTASAEGLGVATPVVAVARAAMTSADVRLVLGAVARVRGRVVKDGTPIAGAAISASTAAGFASRPSFSQPDGSFVLDGVPMGPVVVTAAPYEVRAPKLLTIDRAEVDGVTIEVGSTTSVHGRVTRKGKPVAGAVVGTEEPGHETTADEQGAYTLDGLPAGVSFLRAWDVRQKAFGDATRVTLAPGEDRLVDLELTYAGEIRGTVVDEATRPVEGIYVRFALVNAGDDVCESMTGSDGTFDCPMLMGGDYTAFVAPSPASRQGFAPAAGEHFPVVHVARDEVVTGVRLEIHNERLSIRGTVVDETGAPVPDAHVEAMGRGPAIEDLPSAMTDVNGAFEVDDLARGTYTLHAHTADGGDGIVNGAVTGGAPVTIKLVRSGAIDGTLVGFTRVPTVEATQLGNAGFVEARATVDGPRFSITGLRPGRYTVEATAGAEVDGQAVDIKSGQTAHVTLRSRGVGHVEGTVMEYGTQTPQVGMRCDGNLSMSGQMSGTPPDPELRTFTDAAGHFALTTPLGKVRVFCFHPDGTAMSSAGADVDVTAGGAPALALFSVRPTFGATPGKPGLMLAPGQLPITISSVDAGGPAAAAGIQPGDHLVSVDGGALDGVLPHGAWYLLINHPPGTIATLGIERAGAIRQVSLPLGAP